MYMFVSNIVVSVIFCLCYCDVLVVIDWLCWIFGFQCKLVVFGEDGQVFYVELIYVSLNGVNGMLMFGLSVCDNVYGWLMWYVDEVGGNIQSFYLVVVDFDVLFCSVQVVGVEIVIDIKDEDYGGCGFICCDLEGYVWSFGSYDFWV